MELPDGLKSAVRTPGVRSPPGLAEGTERSGVAAGRAHGQGAQLPGCPQGGAAVAAAPFPRLPHPRRRHPSFRPARSPPSPRRRLPAALPRWPRASQAASERGERSGMGLGGSGEGGDSGRGSGFFRGSREQPPRRTAPPRAARRPATKTRVAAPVSLLRRPRRRRLQVSGARFPRGSPRGPAAPRRGQTGRPPDRPTYRPAERGRTGARGRCPRPACPPSPGPCLRLGAAPPAGRPLRPGARGSRPCWARASGGRRCRDPPGGEKAGHWGRASGARSLHRAHPQCPVGALCPAARIPDLGSHGCGDGEAETC
ncbi:collagen alpha-1(I) chain-like [Lutra lutra]|uniref:collagen alpha-1(I) chain-like n=1 Tax=Lutra lutra TaxID=9657 RepID=UPI001FD0271C|nr:collagen alpha-1(I) chain-like [Lutra lutra]